MVFLVFWSASRLTSSSVYPFKLGEKSGGPKRIFNHRDTESTEGNTEAGLTEMVSLPFEAGEQRAPWSRS